MDLPVSKEFDTFVYEADFVLGDSRDLLNELNAGSDDDLEDEVKLAHINYKNRLMNTTRTTQSTLNRVPIKHEPIEAKKEFKADQEIRLRSLKSARRDDDEDIDIKDRYSPKMETKEQSGSIFDVRKKYFKKTNSPVTIRHVNSFVRSPIIKNILATPTEFHSSPSSTGSELYHLPHRETSNENLERNVSSLHIAKEEIKKELPTPGREIFSPTHQSPTRQSPIRQSPPQQQRYASPIGTPEIIPNSSLIKNEIFQGSAYRNDIPPYKNGLPLNNQPPPQMNRIESPVHRNELLPRNGGTHQQNPIKIKDEFIPPAAIKKETGGDHHDSFNIPNDSYLPNIPRPGENVIVNKNQYSILRLVGEGASGKVFQVYSNTHTDIFALKWVLIKKEEDRQAILNEIKLLMSLKSESSIVKLYDHCNTPKVIYMIMEYGDVSFQQIIANQASKNWDLTFIKFYWLQMLNAVNTIHEKNIVHSDLKPANFVVVKGYLKLIDFGIAKRVSDDTTNIHRDIPVGTVNYMAPEALIDINEGRDDTRLTKHGRPSDIWSLGCILYQMVYGKPPFYHLTMHQRVVNIVNKKHHIKFEPTTVHNNVTITVPPMLIHILKGCLDRSASLRSPMFELLSHPFVNT